MTLALPTPEIYTCAPLHIPMHVIHGRKAGPKVLICATIYGDEVGGIDIVHRLLNLKILKNLSGTLICVPVMNVYGLINHTQMLPDGRDLADSFPGSEKGSFAERLAHLFSSEVITHMTHCINLRCGHSHTYRLPQVYYHPEDSVATQLASVFGAPILKPSMEKTGFFYSDEGVPERPTIIYEAGEAHRTDEYSAKMGVKGITRVLKELGMIKTKGSFKSSTPLECVKSSWIRARASGLFHFRKKVGQHIEEGDIVGVITDPFGTTSQHDVISNHSGIISAMSTHPHVYQGQGIVEICSGKNLESLEEIEVPSIEPEIEV